MIPNLEVDMHGIARRHEDMKVMAAERGAEILPLTKAQQQADADYANFFAETAAAARRGEDIEKATVKLAALEQRAKVCARALSDAQREHAEAKMNEAKLAQDRLAVHGPPA